MGRAVAIADLPALRRCISLPEGEFAEEYWGRRPLLSPAETLTCGFDDLFTLAAVDELLSRRGLRTPFIRMVKSGAVTDPGRYTRSGGTGALVADQVADERVLELFADGHTVVLQGLQRLWPPVIEFAGALKTELGHPVQINAYVTPSGSQGFAAHYDVHDVFVLQIAGQKRWQVHGPVHVDPLRSQPWTDHRHAVEARTAEPALIDVVLDAGDSLYLPRGFLHAAEALGEVSAHLTVGIQPITRHAIVEAIAQLVADEPGLRRSLPLGTDVTRPQSLEAELAVTVEALVTRLLSVTADEVAGALAARIVPSNRPAPLSPIEQAGMLAQIGPNTVLTARRHLRHVISQKGDAVVLLAGDRTLRLPSGTETALEALFEGMPLRLADLPDLNPSEALALARQLVVTGVAVPSPGPADTGDTASG